jgi:hypothetical protein
MRDSILLVVGTILSVGLLALLDGEDVILTYVWMVLI